MKVKQIDSSPEEMATLTAPRPKSRSPKVAVPEWPEAETEMCIECKKRPDTWFGYCEVCRENNKGYNPIK